LLAATDRKAGISVRHSFGDKARDGKSLDPDERPELYEALAAARKRGIPLVVPCISRLIRNAFYHAHHNPEATPTIAEFLELLKLATGVQIITLNDPDATPPKDEAFLRQLAAEVKRRNVGRHKTKTPGDTKDRRRTWKKRVQELRRQGLSYREIADQVYAEGAIGITHGTVRNWCMEGAKAGAGRAAKGRV
jgi:DNA invertase Pin-like site-specific DNA recombinase